MNDSARPDDPATALRLDARLRHVLAPLREKGHSNYGGESVSQLEHALQAAMFARRDGADAELVTAALLHDIGHLLHDLPDDAPEDGVDDRHEHAAVPWLRGHFGPAVVEPIRLHVAAKRYLVSTDDFYILQLSPPSLLSLELQGGPMSAAEVEEFARSPHVEAAVALRRWDDDAKVPGLATPSLEDFEGEVRQALLATLDVDHDSPNATEVRPLVIHPHTRPIGTSKTSTTKIDDPRPTIAVVGAGIVGLAHAWAAASAGARVVVLERSPRAQGASIRNFGMVWPIGQPAGDRHATALRSRELWLEFARASGTWVAECGSLHLARREDELAVLEEFADRAAGNGYDCRLLTPHEVGERSPAANTTGLLAGLWSPTELCVDPRAALRSLPAWLAETHGVDVRFGTAVVAADERGVRTSAGELVAADAVVVCSGSDFETLFPQTFAESGLVRCKLQMLRTLPQPNDWRLGPHLAGGLTLRHYENFADCPSLPALKQRIAAENPALDRYGIHVMAAQNGSGEVVLGDSHEYEDAIEPFDSAEIDRLILEELAELVRLPDWAIAERWHGVYAKHPGEPFFAAEPVPGVHVTTGVGGAGMTMSFGLAETRVAEILPGPAVEAN